MGKLTGGPFKPGFGLSGDVFHLFRYTSRERVGQPATRAITTNNSTLEIRGVRDMIKTAVWFFPAGLIVAIALEVLWRTLGYYSPGGYVVERISRFL